MEIQIKTLMIKTFTFSLILGFLLAPGPSRADLAVIESDLNPEGGVYEINRDSAGRLWISDNDAGEIWAVDPSSGDYTVYTGVGAVSDARHDGQGNLWWVDGAAGKLGTMVTTGTTATFYELPVAGIRVGTAIDSSGNVWISDRAAPQLFRFDPDTRQLCRYPFPTTEGGGSEYLLVSEGAVWLGNWYEDAMLRLDPTSNQFTSWEVPMDIDPVGLTIDAHGNLSWADPDHNFLGLLEPDQDRMTRYTRSALGRTEMITSQGFLPWYTEDFLGTIGRLEPSVAMGMVTELTRTTSSVTPSCSTLGSGTMVELTVTQGKMTTQAVSYSQLVTTDGWMAYELPEGSFTWGITYGERSLWFVDNGRQVLSQMVVAVDIMACKQADKDGDLGTTDDREPRAGWRMYLTVDGVRQMPGKDTAKNGCATWLDLPPEHEYGLEEASEDGWLHLNDSQHDFGEVVAGETYSFTFVNYQITQDIYLPLVLK